MDARIITYFGLLLLGFGLIGLALSQYETTSTTAEEVVRTEEVVHTETYIIYETHTKTVYETEEITRKVTKTETVLSGSVHLWPDPRERPVPQTVKPFQAGFLFEVKSQCRLKINSDKPMTKVKILTPSHWKRAQNNPECYEISPFYEWSDVKVLNTGFDLPPGEYILYLYTQNQELTTDYSIDCTYTGTVTEKIETPKEVTETVPVEKTREVTDTKEVTEIQEKEIVEKLYEYLLFPSLVSSVGGLGITLYYNFIVPMQLGMGGGDAKPPKGRKPTKNERDYLEKRFPGLKNHPYTITGEKTRLYNCIGWSLCSRVFGWKRPPPRFWFASEEEQLREYDDYYKRYGWKKTENCKPEKGYRKIALYRGEKEVRVRGETKKLGLFHAAKQFKDNWWESKLGQNWRILHFGTSSLEGEKYGKVVRCYKKDLRTLLSDAKRMLERVQAGQKRLRSVRPRNRPHREHLDRGKKFLEKAEKEIREQIQDFEKSIKELKEGDKK